MRAQHGVRVGGLIREDRPRVVGHVLLDPSRTPCWTLLFAVVLSMLGCERLPPTKVPVCAEQFEVFCLAPFSRSLSTEEWEKANVCPWLQGFPSDLDDHQEQCSSRPGYYGQMPCYVHAGGRDSRQMYVYRMACIPSETERDRLAALANGKGK